MKQTLTFVNEANPSRGPRVTKKLVKYRAQKFQSVLAKIKKRPKLKNAIANLTKLFYYRHRFKESETTKTPDLRKMA